MSDQNRRMRGDRCGEGPEGPAFIKVDAFMADGKEEPHNVHPPRHCPLGVRVSFPAQQGPPGAQQLT